MAKRYENKPMTPDQLCDVLEVYLGREKGKAWCRKLMSRLEEDPAWRLQLKTLGCTVQVFQQIPNRDVPEEVGLRLLDALDLSGDGDNGCDEA